LVWNCAIRPVMPCTTTRLLRHDRGKCSSPALSLGVLCGRSSRPHGTFGGLHQGIGADDRQAGLGQDLLTLFHIGAGQSHDTGTSTGFACNACTTPSATQSQRLMPAKMLTRIACTFSSDITSRKALATRFWRGAAADVQEVGRLATRQLDRVHRGHRQARAVHDAADVAGQADIGQPRSAARLSRGSSWDLSRSSAICGWRNRRCHQRSSWRPAPGCGCRR
jgi:hypothetical protein